MSDPVAWGVGSLLCFLGVVQLAQGICIARYLLRVRTPPLADAECPEGLVVVCLRGGDPFLSRSLSRLVNQDYPRYRVRIVVDSPDDDAHESIAAALGESPPPHVEIRTLTERRATCTYKMSAILAGTADLPADVAFVALMDGDTVPHATWLRELAAPIVRGLAVVTTGNRWFSPEAPTLGSMCRFWWNAAAVPQMTLFHLPWGGTMAMRRDMIANAQLRDRIGHASSEDTSIGQFAHEQSERVHFEPSLIIVNREEIGLAGFFEFETRQLLFTKLEFYAYWAMALYGCVSLAMLAYPLARLCGLAVGPLVDAAFVFYFLASWGCVLAMGMSIRRVLARRGERPGGWTARRWLFSVLAAFAMPLLHAAAVVRAALMRTVRWRGVLYRVGGRPRVQVVRDEWERSPHPSRDREGAGVDA